MEILLLVLLAASAMLTGMYFVSTVSNGLTGHSWFWRFLMTLLFVFFDLVIMDALNWIVVF